MRVLLIQPPVEDFYDTDVRLQPIGLCYLKAAVNAHLPDIDIIVKDYHSGAGRKTVAIPKELHYLTDYYGVADKSPFDLILRPHDLPTPLRLTSEARSTSSSTRCSSPKGGTLRGRPCACTSPRRPRVASTSSESAGSCAFTRARRPASSSTSSRRARRTPSASSRCTRCSTPTSTARAPASRRRRDAGSSAAHAASSPGAWLVPVTPDVARRLAVIQREWQRIDPKYLDDDEQRFWATIAGRQIRFDQRAEFAKKFAEGRAGQGRARAVPLDLCRREPEPPSAHDRAHGSRRDPVDRADFDDLVTLVTQAPPWEKDRAAGVRILLRAIGRGSRSRRSDPGALDLAPRARDAQGPGPPRLDRVPRGEASPRRRANSRGYRHEENVNRLVQVAREMPLPVGAALLASADGYTPRANAALDRAREELGTIARDRQRARRQPPGSEAHRAQVAAPAPQAQDGGPPRHAPTRPRRPRRRDAVERSSRRASRRDVEDAA